MREPRRLVNIRAPDSASGLRGTARMLGTFLENPLDVPQVVVDYAAEQLDVDDPSCVKRYGERLETFPELKTRPRG